LKGTIIGPEVANGLKASLGDAEVAAQGVDYAAALETNFLPGGADPAGIAVMVSLLNQAASQCPDAKIVTGGYRSVHPFLFPSLSLPLFFSSLARLARPGFLY
jgi:hypothetical protein